MKREFIFVLSLVVLITAAIFYYMRPNTAAKLSNERIQAAVVRVEEATQAAVEIEKKAIEARPPVQAAKQAAIKATEARIETNVQLPSPVQLEIQTLTNLIEALEAQVPLEIARGDAWQLAAKTEHELVLVFQEEHTIQVKSAWRKGLLTGAIGGAVGILIILVIL
jgi:hypothetical protein